MIRLMITCAAVAVAAPAMATDTPPGDTAPATPVTPDSAETATTPENPVEASASANASSQVAAVVDSEFPAYDADSSGDLSKAEFSKWLLALKAQEMKATGKTMAQAELTAWASAAFTTADADSSSAVTKGELAKYLGG